MVLVMVAANAGVTFAAVSVPADRIPTMAEADKLFIAAVEREDGSALLLFDV